MDQQPNLVMVLSVIGWTTGFANCSISGSSVFVSVGGINVNPVENQARLGVG